MDILWGDHPDRPEGANELNHDNLAACEGDLMVIEPGGPYKGPRIFPKGRWIEVWPNKSFNTIRPNVWTTGKIRRRVGILAGFDYELSNQLAYMSLEGKAHIIDVNANIAVINGPNLNLLGEFDTASYGTTSLEQIFRELKVIAPSANFVFRQTNVEGEMVTLIQQLRHESDAIIINAGAYANSSIAILDALKCFEDQVIELHITNPYQREDFRHTSYIAPAADSYIAGFGVFGYKMALTAALSRL